MIKLKYWAFKNFFGSGNRSEPELPQAETITFTNRVIADGGKILDEVKLNSFYKANKEIGKYNSLQFAVSKQFGYKVEGGNIVKIYDASKNGNDLVIARGAVPENEQNVMFFINEAHFKKSSASIDITGNKFSLSTKINHPSPEAKGVNYFIGIGELCARAGGGIGNAPSYASFLGTTRSYAGVSGSFNNENDAGIDRWLTFRHHTNVTQSIAKDGVIIPGTNSGMLSYEFTEPSAIITYGARGDESTMVDFDGYINDTFFYNDYLTDQELQIINQI